VITQVALPESTRDRFLAAGMRLFAAKGYQSTSIADLLLEVGAHSGSFYHFFPTKQDLLLAVLKAYRDGIESMLLAPAGSHSIEIAGLSAGDFSLSIDGNVTAISDPNSVAAEPVPELSTWAMIAVGFACMAFLGWRFQD